VPKLNEMGITVKYALYSRTGNGTLTSRQLSEVVCAQDKKAVLAKFFAAPMRDAAGGNCKQTQGLEKIAKVAQQVGLKGTPHIVSDSGFSFSGYESASSLMNMLKNGS
jgi:thiol:disulfide interchange protein DsbC